MLQAILELGLQYSILLYREQSEEMVKNTTGIIYLIAAPNGKHYVGQTTQGLARRKTEHIVDAKTSKLPIARAILKYGDQLKWSILFNNISINYLDKLESWAINHFNSKYNGYNCTTGGYRGCRGYNHTEEAKEKIRQSKMGNKSRLGKPHTQETKKKMSEAQKGKPRNSESIKKMAETKKGSKLSEEHKLNCAISHGAVPFQVYTKEGNYIGEWISQSQCARELNLNFYNISRCLKRPEKHKSHKGYIFKHKENVVQLNKE